jgi:hypothetical protein
VALALAKEETSRLRRALLDAEMDLQVGLGMMKNAAKVCLIPFKCSFHL